MMEDSLIVLCNTLKKLISELMPQQKGLSLTLLIGKDNQGKKSILEQSTLKHINIDDDHGIAIHHNDNGVIITICDSWLHYSKSLLQNTLKDINRSHPCIMITGIILCIDINELLIYDPIELSASIKSHAKIINKFGLNLGYAVDSAIIINKLDTVAGFSEFYHHEHITDLNKPLGFSIHKQQSPSSKSSSFKDHYEIFIESLGQQVIHKIHPERSSLKRTFIREFPLQLASGRLGIQSLIEVITNKNIRLNYIYFTSAEQGGVSIDRLNIKIKHEFALVTQDKYPQSANYRPYFIEGAIISFQNQTKCTPLKQHGSKKWIAGSISAIMGISLIIVAHDYYKSTRTLDEASKELIGYERLVDKNDKANAAIFHLTKASSILNKLDSKVVSSSATRQLSNTVSANSKTQLSKYFIPFILNEVELVITNNNNSIGERYQALKVYLMLANTEYYSKDFVSDWFKYKWSTSATTDTIEQQISLLDSLKKFNMLPLKINQQIVSDLRNYFNALPTDYLYYSIAKNSFSNKVTSIDIKGFNLSQNYIPMYFTKAGFETIISMLPTIASQINQENWILKKQTGKLDPDLLEQAYSYDYMRWWSAFIKKTTPIQVHNYKDALNNLETINKNDSLSNLLALVQLNTSPEINNIGNRFNDDVASKFTDINLISKSAIHDLTRTLPELEKLLSTMSAIHDEGKTAFTITKSRFNGDKLSNPLSSAFNHAEQLPNPVSSWAKQIAENIWFLLINDSKQYINRQWQKTVFNNYELDIKNHFPFSNNPSEDLSLANFNAFFAPHGKLKKFASEYIYPFLDTSSPQWQAKELNGYALSINDDAINELIRANIINSMFFTNNSDDSHIEFELKKLGMDTVISSMNLEIGNRTLTSTQNDFEEPMEFVWPKDDASLSLRLIDGKSYSIKENGLWAIFKLLKKVNILSSKSDDSSLQILFEINGNSGRYLLTTKSPLNPFTPGILNDFHLRETIV